MVVFVVVVIVVSGGHYQVENNVHNLQRPWFCFLGQFGTVTHTVPSAVPLFCGLRLPGLNNERLTKSCTDTANSSVLGQILAYPSAIICILPAHKWSVCPNLNSLAKPFHASGQMRSRSGSKRRNINNVSWRDETPESAVETSFYAWWLCRVKKRRYAMRRWY